MKGCKRGDRPVSLPLAPKRLLRFTRREADEALTEAVPVAKLVATQKCVNTKWVREGAAKPAERNPHPPLVVKSGDAYYVQDGHHRAEMAKLRGDETLRARVVDKGSDDPFWGTR